MESMAAKFWKILENMTEMMYLIGLVFEISSPFPEKLIASLSQEREKENKTSMKDTRRAH